MEKFVGYCSMCGSKKTYLTMETLSYGWVRWCEKCGYTEELLSIPDKRFKGKGKGDK